jgi:hypothetical protein
MIFTRYIGTKLETPAFTPGKIYTAIPGFSDGGAVDMTQIRLNDDNGVRRIVGVDSGSFDFPEQVCAVVLKPVLVFEKGQVVSIIGVDEASEFYEVGIEGKSGAYLKASYFELLDRTNVTPGCVVLHEETRRWLRVTAVDDMLNLHVELGSFPVTDFRFPVGADGVLSEPLFKCVSASGAEDELAEGKTYRAERLSPDGELVFVRNDKGEVCSYMVSRFTADV